MSDTARTFDRFTSSAATPREEWITIPDAARSRNVSDATIRRMISRGEIEAVRLGPRLIRVKRTSLDAAGTPLRYSA